MIETFGYPILTAKTTEGKLNELTEYIVKMVNKIETVTSGIDTDNLSQNLYDLINHLKEEVDKPEKVMDIKDWVVTQSNIGDVKWLICQSAFLVFNGKSTPLLSIANGICQLDGMVGMETDLNDLKYGYSAKPNGIKNYYKYGTHSQESSMTYSLIECSDSNGNVSNSTSMSASNIKVKSNDGISNKYLDIQSTAISNGIYLLDFATGYWNGNVSHAYTASTADEVVGAIDASKISGKVENARVADVAYELSGNTGVTSGYGVGWSDRSISFVPIQSGVIHCGSNSNQWADIRAVSGEIVTSDENLKHDIKDLTDAHMKFIMMVAPKSFILNIGESGRTHIGFIAQDVKACMDACGLTDMDFAGWIKDKDEDGNETYGLRYEEFISLITYAVQNHEQRLKALEDKLNILMQEGDK